MKNKVLIIMAVAVLLCVTIFAGVFIGRTNKKDIIASSDKSDTSSKPAIKNELLDINRISAEELIVLLGINPSLAEEIIAYRNTFGDFVYISELKNVPGMTDYVYEEIRPYLTLSD